MLWSPISEYTEQPFESEEDLEAGIAEVAVALFGEKRIFLPVKKKIGSQGGIQTIPDGSLIDLWSARQPRLFVVEVELERREPLRHIAVQIFSFSLSFEETPQKVKEHVKTALTENADVLGQAQDYAIANGFENVDFLLERLILGEDKFNALVIIDELPDDLERVLISRFKFPVEIVTLERYAGSSGHVLYRFEPFLGDVTGVAAGIKTAPISSLDPSDIDTIVVPAREDGFRETFLKEDRWYAIRIHSSMIPRIRYIAAYRVAPESAITHLAAVGRIEPYKETNKSIVYFEGPADPIGPLRAVPGGTVRPPQGPRYTSRARLLTAKDLDGAF